ncbi:MAG: hypothetical protein ACXWVP_04635 [Burkholderiales bacterium]
MVGWLLLVVGLLGFPAWAAGDIAQEIRRVETALSRIAADQQVVYQQFQMVQVMLRGEESKMQPLQSYTPPSPPPNYDTVMREQNARAARIKHYQDELDRLYSRYLELETRRAEFVQTLSALAQQRGKETER